MEAKKNPKLDVTRNSPFYFSLALCASLVFIIAAFEWKTYDASGLVDLGNPTDIFDELLDIPITEQPPPPPPKKAPIVIEIEEVDDEEIIEEVEIIFDIEITEDDVIEIFIAEESVVEEDIDEIITVAEEMPTPVGGYAAFYKFVSKNIKYPAMAKKLGREGRVVLEIIIGKDGQLEDAKVVKEIGFGCDEEALRVIKLWEKWNPGRQRGVPRRIRMYLPLIFKLTD